jgi:hypothetical protein
MRWWLAITLVAACAPATRLPAQHPARRDAPAGRLAGPPPALRAGVADDARGRSNPPAEPPVHHH